MYLLNPTYFIKEYTIPNINDAGDALTTLTEYVDEWARYAVRNALGNVLFPIFDGYVAAGVFNPSTDPNVVPLKWQNFVNGCDYTIDGVVYTWRGLLKTEGLYKSSLLVPLCYHYWLAGQSELMTGVGLKVVDAKNAININPTQKLVNAYNSFVEQYQGECSDNGQYNRGYYHNGVWIIDWFGGREEENKYVSLVRFLKDNPTDYPDAQCKVYDVMNQLGL